MTSVHKRHKCDTIIETEFGTVTLNEDWDIDSYHDVVVKRAGERLVVGFIVPDEFQENPFEDFDGSGKIIIFNDRYASRDDRREACTALGLDEYGDRNLEMVDEDAAAQRVIDGLGKEAIDNWAEEEWDYAEIAERDGELPTGKMIERELLGQIVLGYAFENEYEAVRQAMWEEGHAAGTIGVPYVKMLSAYIHSGIVVRLLGEDNFPDRQWDVSGGIWIPSKDELEYIMSEPEDKRNERARELARGDIELYNQWQSGDCWGVVTAEFVWDQNSDSWEQDGDEDSCWGYWGDDYAEKEMKASVDCIVARLTKEEVPA